MGLWVKSNTFIKNKLTMLQIFKNIYFDIGLFFMLIGITMILLPPKFGNFLYGVRTKITMKNKTVWANGQRLFAFLFLTIGVIFSLISVLKLDEVIKPFPMVLLLVFLYKLIEYFIHKFLVAKFPDA